MTTNDSDNQTDSDSQTGRNEAEQPDKALAAGLVTENGGLIVDLVVSAAAAPLVQGATSRVTDRVRETVKENRANRQHAEAQYAKDADDARRGAPKGDA